MIILGIDPGSRVTGYGVLEVAGNKARTLGAGTIRLDREPDMPARLHRLHQALDELVTTWKPDHGSVETQFHGVNAKSALVVGQVRGVVLLSFARHGLEWGEYPPATVKKSVTGNGQAAKEQVAAMLESLTGATGLAASMDAADALGIAYTHWQHLASTQV